MTFFNNRKTTFYLILYILFFISFKLSATHEKFVYAQLFWDGVSHYEKIKEGEATTLPARSNDKAESVKVYSEWASFYKEAYYKGPSLLVEKDWRITLPDHWIHVISSVKEGRDTNKDFCLYTKINYKGIGFCFNYGEYRLEPGIAGKVKSITVRSPITVYKNVGYSGDSKVYSENVASVPSDWGENIKSVWLNRATCLYTGVYFSGSESCIEGDTAELPSLIRKKAKSLQTLKTITVFDKKNYQGNSNVYFSKVSDLRDTGWANKIASIRYGDVLPEDAIACLYEHINYGIPRLCVNEGTPNLGSFNDKASSIKVTQAVRVYEDIDYEGASTSIYRNNSDLSLSGWNDLISSIDFNDQGIPSSAIACFYSEHTYRGDRYCIYGDESNFGAFNDRAKSVKINTTITVYENNEFQGDELVIKQNIRNLAEWDNRISSAKTGNQGWPVSAIACFYSGHNYEGERYCIEGDTSNFYGFSDRAKSVKVKQTITVFEHADYQGEAFLIDSDISNLGDWDNRISSAKKGDQTWRPNTIACFYIEHDFKGQRYCIDGDTPWFGPFSHQIKSVKVKETVTAYDERSYQGEDVVISSDISNLGAWDDRITSVRKGDFSWPESAVACFFSKHNYDGERYCIDADTPWFADFNDQAESVKIKETITVFEDASYGGQAFVIRSNMPHLGDWDDRITSARTGEHGLPFAKIACFYSEHNFEGDTYCIDDDVFWFADFNDRAKSVKIQETVTVYENAFYQGRSRVINKDVLNLGDWDNDISSARKGTQGWPEGAIACFYTQPNFTGGRYCINDNTPNFGSFAAKAQSLKAKEVITVYDEADYEGNAKDFNGDHSDLGYWNKRIVSVRKGNYNRFLVCLYELRDYKGLETCFDRDVGDFGEHEGGNGHDGSIRIFNPDKYGDGRDSFGSVVLFTDKGFRGAGHEHEEDHPNMMDKSKKSGGIDLGQGRQTRANDGFGSAKINGKDSDCN